MLPGNSQRFNPQSREEPDPIVIAADEPITPQPSISPLEDGEVKEVLQQKQDPIDCEKSKKPPLKLVIKLARMPRV